jgi:hypothetical protein
MSLVKKYGKNFILSKLVANPIGLDDPFSWRKIRWAKTNPTTINGSKKCREKNRFRVGCETEKFPHNHRTMSFPTYGTAVNILVITVAPQNDIWPQGSTYPKNAVPIEHRRIITPDTQTILIFFGDSK